MQIFDYIMADKNEITRRELEILKHIEKGKTSAEIAGILCISMLTVETHRSHISKKLGTSSPVEMLNAARRKGLI